MTRGNERPADPLDYEVQYLRRVGPQRAKMLAKIGIVTCRDLLWHAPRDYEDLRTYTPIRFLRGGEANQVRGKLEFVKARESRSRVPTVEATFSDGTGLLSVVWYHRPFVAEKFRLESEYRIVGKAVNADGRWKMANPTICEIADDDLLPTELQPVYPTTEGLHQAALRQAVKSALAAIEERLVDVVPVDVRKRLRMRPLEESYRHLHFPPENSAAIRARNRFVFEELFALQIALAAKRAGQKQVAGHKLTIGKRLDERIRRLFPYALTAAQNRVVAELVADLSQSRPMYRMIQGDVGCGKTAIAAYAILAAIANGFQTALLAPTEVLARQHFRTFDELLANSKVRRLLLTGGMAAKARDERLRWLAEGDFDLVVGTHALLEPKVQFKRLGLVVVDEQHKFGVRQRAQLRRFTPAPHQLVMTATPIPRSLGMTWFGDLDLSIVDAKPPGRLDTLTYVLTERDRHKAYDFLERQIGPETQALVVCPRIEKVEELGLRSVMDLRKELAERRLPDDIVGVVHGKLDEAVKDQIVRQFRLAKLQILVATVVVEVGLDVPAANMVIVENAERFGLSQLHQIRGRVGRGGQRGICFLMVSAADPETMKRLRAFSKTNDGFVIAEMDARLRGTGEVVGTKQHGAASFRIADPLADFKILELARREAQRLIAQDPSLTNPELASLRRLILARYGKLLELANIG